MMSRSRYGRDIDKRHARTGWNRSRQASSWQLGRESKHSVFFVLASSTRTNLGLVRPTCQLS